MDAIETLGEEIGQLSARVDAATQRLLACIRQFDEAGGWHRQGALSCAHWLAWRIGLDTATARERCRVARALGSLPSIDQAFARGELSYAKVRAITRVATPENEARLLELARHATGAQLERICRGLRQVNLNMAMEVGEQPPPEERSVRERHLPGGMVRLELTLSPDEAALILQAVEKARDQLREAQPEAQSPAAEGSAEAPAALRMPATRADGALLLARSFFAGGEANGAGGGSADRYQVLVHLDQDVLAPDGEMASTLDDGTRVSAETFRRIACDAGLVVTRTAASDANPGGVLDIGRKTRSIPPAIRRALGVRDRGCRFPGCLHTRFLHGHHIQHWLHGGSTSLDNLILLCPRHHHMVHEEGFTIHVASDGALVFGSPGRRPLVANPSRPAIEDAARSLQEWATEQDIEITPTTNLPWWDGAMPDYDWTISTLGS
jgi:hypothetical protein